MPTLFYLLDVPFSDEWHWNAFECVGLMNFSLFLFYRTYIKVCEPHYLENRTWKSWHRKRNHFLLPSTHSDDGSPLLYVFRFGNGSMENIPTHRICVRWEIFIYISTMSFGFCLICTILCLKTYFIWSFYFFIARNWFVDFSCVDNAVALSCAGRRRSRGDIRFVE